MTNDELIENLDEFGGHINVLVKRETDTEQFFYAVENVDYMTVAGEGYIVIEIEKTDPYAS